MEIIYFLVFIFALKCALKVMLPTQHIGVSANAMEKRGIESQRGKGKKNACGAGAGKGTGGETERGRRKPSRGSKASIP